MSVPTTRLLRSQLQLFLSKYVTKLKILVVYYYSIVYIMECTTHAPSYSEVVIIGVPPKYHKLLSLPFPNFFLSEISLSLS